MNILPVGNRLGAQKSPYLLQHKDNPVWWWPWCDEAFSVAREQDKPVFLSIGYATCYWCHVMERDSFELEEVAAYLNPHFISIKLDREERPDLDAIYMDAVVGMTGHGGWPMSVFLTPDRVPFWAGTFFYKAQFLQILERVNHFWQNDREKILGSAQQIGGYLLRRSSAERRAEVNSEVMILWQSATRQLESRFDATHGGFGGAPKFPPTGPIAFLCCDPESSAARVMIQTTLDGMARGGFYDQIGGGFARYSTDDAWLIPHFEKMLYDNALLVRAYLDGWQVLGRPAYFDIAQETLEFVSRELSTPDGAFASALDAGSVGEEGEYYVWAHREVQSLLSEEEFQRFSEVYSLTPEGNFEAKNTVLAIAGAYPLEVRDDVLLVHARRKLRESRSARVRPICDDKVIVSWNALMIAAFARGFALTGHVQYRDIAVRAADFVLSKLYVDGRLMRRYRDNEVAFDACLEDYAYLIDALIELALATDDYSWFVWANKLHELQDQVLWDEQGGAYLSSASPDLIVRRHELPDGALPSPNAIALLNLYRLSILMDNGEFTRRAEALDQTLRNEAIGHPESFSRYLVATRWNYQSAQLVLVVPEGESIPEVQLREWKRNFRPGLMLFVVREGQPPVDSLPLLAGKSSLNGQLTGYLCRGRTCQPPSVNIDQLLESLQRKP